MARAVATARGDRAGLAEAEWHLAQIAYFETDFEAALAAGQRALAMARAADSREFVARALNHLSYCELFLGALDAAAAHGEEAALLYAELGNRSLEIDSRLNGYHASILAGRAGQGLVAAREVDNAEPAHAEAKVAIGEMAGIVGTAMDDTIALASNDVPFHGRPSPAVPTGDAAHAQSLLSRLCRCRDCRLHFASRAQPPRPC